MCCFLCKARHSSSWSEDDSTAFESAKTGNFIQLVQFRAENEVLHIYLETVPKNALYTFKTIQNEMSVLGSAIQDHFIQEIKAAKIFSVFADEGTDCANLEQISFVIRFVDSNKHIREELVDYHS